MAVYYRELFSDNVNSDRIALKMAIQYRIQPDSLSDFVCCLHAGHHGDT